MTLYQELLSSWQNHKQLISPPENPLQLWRTEGCSVWIGNAWGPAVPYGARDHGDGRKNHGYVQVKGNVNAISRIPEVEGWPELEQFLVTINALDTPIESVGCEKGYALVEDTNDSTTRLGMYVDLVFSDAPLNDHPESFLLLASHLIPAVEGCQKWWGDVEICLYRFRFVEGASLPWGLMLRIINDGRSEEEARTFWSETLTRLSEAIRKLPKDFGSPLSAIGEV